MGYSHGAAVTDLLVRNLTDEFGVDSVYGYSFATPKVATAENNTHTYENSHIVVSKIDPVGYLAPDSFGFKHCGDVVEAPASTPTAQAVPTGSKAGRQDSTLSLKVKKKILKKGERYTIRVKNVPKGQKVTFSVSKAVKKKGVSVGKSTGTVAVGKKAQRGTYQIKVKAVANKKYKTKTLVFTLKVK